MKINSKHKLYQTVNGKIISLKLAILSKSGFVKYLSKLDDTSTMFPFYGSNKKWYTSEGKVNLTKESEDDIIKEFHPVKRKDNPMYVGRIELGLYSQMIAEKFGEEFWDKFINEGGINSLTIEEDTFLKIPTKYVMITNTSLDLLEGIYRIYSRL